MAQNDFLKRYIDAALSFSEVTQSRAEALVKDLVKAGEVQADQARDAVTDLLERSRKSSQELLETVRREVRAQITNLGLASQADLDRIEDRISSLLGTAAAPARKATASAKKATKKATRKAPAKKAPAKAAPAKKKAPAKKAPAKKSVKRD
jgi:polyhydroxyalkanoate synthesis regulator phasin